VGVRFGAAGGLSAWGEVVGYFYDLFGAGDGVRVFVFWDFWWNYTRYM